jgi:hypothetical protein
MRRLVRWIGTAAGEGRYRRAGVAGAGARRGRSTRCSVACAAGVGKGQWAGVACGHAALIDAVRRARRVGGEQHGRGALLRPCAPCNSA